MFQPRIEQIFSWEGFFQPFQKSAHLAWVPESEISVGRRSQANLNRDSASQRFKGWLVRQIISQHR